MPKDALFDRIEILEEQISVISAKSTCLQDGRPVYRADQEDPVGLGPRC